jgi:hypothetical protein
MAVLSGRKIEFGFSLQRIKAEYLFLGAWNKNLIR